MSGQASLFPCAALLGVTRHCLAACPARATTSAIHITYNRVTHRFAADVLSTVWLYGRWATFAWVLLAATAGYTPPAP
jgi:hypothetical protein